MDDSTPHSSANPPLVEVTLNKTPHAWPQWEQFAPPVLRQDGSLRKLDSFNDTGNNGTSSESDKSLEDAVGDEGNRYGSNLRPRLHQEPQVTTVALLALTMCIGVFLVGLFGFLPMYWIGFRDVNAAVQASQSQAVASMVASAVNSLGRLPNIMKLVAARQLSSCQGNAPCKRVNPVETLVAICNVLSIKRYRDFFTVMAGMQVSYGQQSYVGVSIDFSNSTLSGFVGDQDDPINLYAIDPETHMPETPRRLIYTSKAMGGTYIDKRKALVEQRCEADMAQYKKETQEDVNGTRYDYMLPKEIWTPCTVAERYAYFGVLIPLRLSSVREQCNGCMEAGLRSVYIAGVFQDHFRYAIRQHGCYMLVDLLRQVVVINSWNQSRLPEMTLDGTFVPFSTHEVDHPLMTAAIAFLRSQHSESTIEEAIALADGSEQMFSFHDEAAGVRVTSIAAPNGLDVKFISVTLRRDFFTSIYRTQRILLFTVLAAVLSTAIGSYVAAVYLRRAIEQLTVALRASSKLQFPSLGSHNKTPLAHITELMAVETAYVRVQQQLMVLKTVVPCPLLIADDAELSGSDRETESATTGGSRTATEMSVEGRPGSPTVGLRVDSLSHDLSSGDLSFRDISPSLEEQSMRVSKRWRQNVVLNTKVFNEKVNVFRKQYCTVVWINRYYGRPFDDATQEEFFRAVYNAAMEFKGCLQHFRPDYTVITFNAHISLPLHAKHGCDMALSIRQRLSPASAAQMTMLVDTSNFLVGTCGSETGLKSRVVVDVVHLFGLGILLRQQNFHQVVVTQSTAKHLEFYETIPLDVVTVPFREAPYTLFELRDASAGTVAEMQRTATLFRSGFQHMRRGDYVKALKAYNRVSSTDATTLHFKNLCVAKIRDGNKEQYMRYVHLPTMRLLSRFIRLRTCDHYMQCAIRSWRRCQVKGVLPPGPFLCRSSANEYSSGETPEALRASFIQVCRSAAPGCSGSLTEGVSAQHDGGLLLTAERFHVRGAAAGEGTEGRRCSNPGLAEQSTTSSSTGSITSDGGLIEWIDFPSVSASEDAEAISAKDADSPTENMDSIPLSLLDSNGGHWNRALKAEHSTQSSMVYQAMADGGLQVAIKFLPKKNRKIPEARLHKEIEVMTKLKHLNIVQYISFACSEAYVGIVMEYAPGGSLRDIINGFGALPESLVRRYMVDVLHGLAYLHRGGITHGDVKPHNILLGADGVCKLSDFGSTVCEATDLARSNGMLEFRGTAVYTSPEVAVGQLPTAASDIHSLGISFLEMLLGRLPWQWVDSAEHVGHSNCMTLREVAFVQAVGRGEIAPVVPRELSSAAQEFARACCHKNPSERPTINELLSFRFVL